MYTVGWVIGLLELSLGELCKCLISMLFCMPATNKKNNNKEDYPCY